MFAIEIAQINQSHNNTTRVICNVIEVLTVSRKVGQWWDHASRTHDLSSATANPITDQQFPQSFHELQVRSCMQPEAGKQEERNDHGS